jgi:hypothetical protein
MAKRKTAAADRDVTRWVRAAIEGVVTSQVFLALKLPFRDPAALRRDPQIAAQLGAALLLDRPIVFLVEEGTTLPARIRAIADRVETFTPGDTASLKRATMRALTATAAAEAIRQ